MNEDALLLLGILMNHSQHGYQIYEFIDQNLSHISDMKKATAYDVLERLNKAGYVSVHHEQEGNRPVRKVYTITSAGENKFYELLRVYLATAPRMSLPGDISLMLLGSLPLPEVIECLNFRLSQLEEQIVLYEQAPANEHPHSLGIKLTTEHLILHLRVEKEWLTATIKRLQEDVGRF